MADVRLRELEEELVEAIKKIMRSKGFVDPNTTDAVRYALNLAALSGGKK